MPHSRHSTNSLFFVPGNELGLDEIAALFTGERHAPSPLTDAERERFASRDARRRARACRRRFSRNGWRRLSPRVSATRRPRPAGRWRSGRRSTFASTRSRPIATRRSRRFRIWSRKRRRCRRSACASCRARTGAAPALSAEPAYIKGLVEVQDEGSQLSALLSGAQPGHADARPLRRRRRQDARAGGHDEEPGPDLLHRQ